jgi:hypothetical protein
VEAAPMKFFLLMMALWFVWLAHVSDWQWLYALQYDVESAHVTIDNKPHDCEWGAAPIGEKNCHYERVIHYDDGKAYPRPDGYGAVPAVAPFVHVSWSKVND